MKLLTYNPSLHDTIEWVCNYSSLADLKWSQHKNSVVKHFTWQGKYENSAFALNILTATLSLASKPKHTNYNSIYHLKHERLHSDSLHSTDCTGTRKNKWEKDFSVFSLLLHMQHTRHCMGMKYSPDTVLNQTVLHFVWARTMLMFHLSQL